MHDTLGNFWPDDLCRCICEGPYGKEKLKGPNGEKAETIMYANVKPLPRLASGNAWYDYKPE